MDGQTDERGRLDLGGAAEGARLCPRGGEECRDHSQNLSPLTAQEDGFSVHCWKILSHTRVIYWDLPGDHGKIQGGSVRVK